jgi:hypothetical protein
MSGYFRPKIIARIPKYWPLERMALLDYKTREIVGIAEPVESFAFDDPRGAMLSKQVDKARRKAIRQLDRSTPDVDTLAEGLRLAAQVPDATVRRADRENRPFRRSRSNRAPHQRNTGGPRRSPAGKEPEGATPTEHRTRQHFEGPQREVIMPFVETSVSRDIFRTIDTARELQKNAAIVGRPGVGKSFALTAYTKSVNAGRIFDRHASIWQHREHATADDALRSLRARADHRRGTESQATGVS